MHIAHGKDRCVLVLPALGIVVKFPIIRLWRALCYVVRDSKNRRWKSLFYCLFTWNPDSHYLVSGMILKGIMSNVRERGLWKKTRNPFLQPTPFSVLGLLNIQRYGKPLECNPIDLWSQVADMTRKEAHRNSHQFSEPENYALVDGRLRILDYGGHGSTWVVVRYGRRIVDGFDPAFRWSGK